MPSKHANNTTPHHTMKNQPAPLPVARKLATKKPSTGRIAWRSLIHTAMIESVAAREPFPDFYQRLWQLREEGWLGTSDKILSTEPGRVISRIRHHIPAVSRFSFNAMFLNALRDVSAQLGLRAIHVENICGGIRNLAVKNGRSAKAQAQATNNNNNPNPKKP